MEDIPVTEHHGNCLTLEDYCKNKGVRGPIQRAYISK